MYRLKAGKRKGKGSMRAHATQAVLALSRKGGQRIPSPNLTQATDAPSMGGRASKEPHQLAEGAEATPSPTA